MTPTLSQLQLQLGVPLNHLVTDSRTLKSGDVFMAYPGEKTDGRQFIAQAILQGAAAVIWDAHNFVWDKAWTVPNIGISDLRHNAGFLADAIYGEPSKSLRMIGVTGTNGKTSTCNWIAQALGDAGKKCALIGTLGNGFVNELEASANTTPDAIRVQGLLADFLNSGAQAAAMEVSSHALAQGRVNGVRFDVALLTNLSRDHLDYHGDMESYAATKRRLFDWQSLNYAVINLDDAFGAELALQLVDKTVEVIGYGTTDEALRLAERHGLRMVYGVVLEMDSHGMKVEVRSSWGAAQLSTQMVGRFNVSNLLGALGVLLVSDVTLDAAVASLNAVQPVTGRMQKLGGNDQPLVIVDYAHTPDALEKVLLALCEAAQGTKAGGQLICVFGCGGDRDRGKRAMMGRVAEKFADRCIVTSDNPRSEDAQQIIGEVIAGMNEGRHEVISDRADAIGHAIAMAGRADIVLIAGKGHEDYQEIKGVKHPFSDVNVATQALKTWMSQPGVTQ
ncbi:MAG: UDP-N-acetylmuramoyl-L-alanyl-D-glutamate--2,6-diaminopimelate ligase [Gallionella sp.]|jgi:UDP-N-acetylmuramoyl-L-alanyl-D-glutamate--2,6-diaminopimelate ligase